MEQAKPMARRKHDAQLKELVVAACALPGASVARIALEHGLNANLTLPRFRVHLPTRPCGRVPCPPGSDSRSTNAV